MRLLLTTGAGLEPSPDANILVLDWESRTIVDSLCYRNQIYDETHKGFTGAAWMGDRLLVATEAEVLELETNPLRVVQSWSTAFLNDIHHVSVSKDRIWICNSGLDCIEELDLNWRHLATHSLIPSFGRSPREVVRLLWDDVQRSWSRLRGHYRFYDHLPFRPPFRNMVKMWDPHAYRTESRDLRYFDFRPHALHPNHTTPIGDDVWVTLWRTGAVVSLRTKRIIADNLGRPHDGVIAGDEFLLTESRHNRLIVMELDHQRPALGRRLIDRQLTTDVYEGYLRGVAASDSLVFAGLSVRRGAPNKWAEARIVVLDRKTYERVDEWRLPPELGRTVFQIDVVPNGIGLSRKPDKRVHCNVA